MYLKPVGAEKDQGGDTCSNATPVYLNSPISGSTTGATGNPGCCNGSNDVWYYYDAGFTGNIDISLFGSNFDTVLGSIKIVSEVFISATMIMRKLFWNLKLTGFMSNQVLVI